jgi:hypothetical protein
MVVDMSVDPLSVQCPACLVGPGESCYATSSDLPRNPPHRLRGLAAARHLTLCEQCKGVGWRPEGYEVKEA